MSRASIGIFRALDPHVVELAHRLCTDGGRLWRAKPRRERRRGFAQGIGPQALQPTLRIFDAPPSFGRTLPALLMFTGRAERRCVRHGRPWCVDGAVARAPRHLKVGELLTEKVAEGPRRFACRPRRSTSSPVEKAPPCRRELLGRIDERRKTKRAIAGWPRVRGGVGRTQ